MQSQQEIKIWLEENKITEVECLVPDMTGNARGKFIPAKKFLKEDSRLPEGILAQTVTGQYSDDYWELLETIDGDMLLEPDSKTKRTVPWANETTGQIIHDCFTKNGEPHPFSTRAVLKHILSLYKEDNLTPGAIEGAWSISIGVRSNQIPVKCRKIRATKPRFDQN